MPSSTSSFERYLPAMRWGRILGVALFLFLVFVLFMEIRLAQLGYRPTVHDSDSRWARERSRASDLGTQAIILVGASRIQLDVDMDVLQRETGLKPVQLASDGSAASAPILAGLAADPMVTGTVIVDYYDGAIGGRGGAAAHYQQYYERHGKGGASGSPNERIEKVLTERLHESLLSYADEANPLNSLRARIVAGISARRIVTTLPDRSRFADFAVAEMPTHYYRRVASDLGVKLDTSSPNIETVLKKQIASLKPMEDTRDFVQGMRELKNMVSAIEARGGRVLFLALPTSGMIREIEERLYPRTQFWDQFKKEFGGKAIRSADHDLLKKFTCPDGSHLDLRDRAEFTVAMSHALDLTRNRADSRR